MAFILNDQKALNGFMQDNKFSLNAEAGLTVVEWSKRGEGLLGWGDITAWSDTEGLFGGAVIALTDIRFDAAETTACYRKPVTARDVVAGRVATPARRRAAHGAVRPRHGRRRRRPGRQQRQQDPQRRQRHAPDPARRTAGSDQSDGE